RVLANGCIETWYVQGLGVSDALPEVFPAPPVSGFRVRRIGMGAMSDGDLERVSREAHLFLSVEEMRAIQSHFRGIGRDPTDLELETVAQTWSEHCVHKTLKSEIEYCGEDFGRRGCVTVRFENLLKDTIVKATETLARDWCLSVFTDNAGVIALDDAYGIAFKAETHNHPSAIEPYGGAATGVGGCIRDIMGCGLGAKPIASTDVFCLAPPDSDAARLPKDVLHPRRVYRGVVRGVRDYGNRMGIPTVNGAVYFDERYIGNPLVFCGCVGLIPRDRIDKAPRPGDRIVVAGGRTGRDGIHGATFSSAELTDSHADEFSHAVQIGNAIEEKKLLDAMLLARDHAGGCLYSAVTDCGAGGLSSAVGEMAEHLGAVVDLEKVPLKYSGLRYDEIWISEAQERMVFAVPPEHVDALLGVFAAEEVEATVIGRFGDDRVLRVRYDGAVVGELDMGFLHDGLPRRKRRATWTGRAVVLGSRGPLQRDADGDDATRREDAGLPGALGDAAAGGRAAVAGRPGGERLLRALARDNTASKEWVIRQYDHEVQGRSVVKPLVGPGDGPSDAAVLRPRLDGYRGIALGCGLCPHVGDVDPYLMAVAAVDEALRNVISVGADPARTAILDNFCWGACDTGSALGGLVRACKGASDAAIAYGLPFISGKDSLNNEFVQDARDARRVGLPARIVIPGTLLISALGIVRDVRRCVTMDLKRPGGCLVLASAPVDRVGLEAARSMHDRVAALIAGGRVLSCHDVSDGGLAVGIAEMCIASGLGARVAVDRAVFDDTLFAEAHTTYVLEMGEADAAACGLPVIGHVEAAPRLQIDGDLGDGVQERDAAQGMGPAAGMDRIDCAVRDLAAAWRSERLSA
ncbi:MAG: AIR synthase-related protein, partial [Phycisphaerae bacterium]